ncbi:MAG: manganese efflux pump [Phycisphaerales bacterium]|jgi:manganese efflux pump family protein|nr:manganese efflux pump [Phycisphaerales bacterium]MBT7170727.1 manganese efflux pump [Phycisphaerales bacterium]
MHGWELILVAFSLAMDAFAVSIAAGITLPAVTGRHVFRLSFHFGLFQFLMPVAGYLLGQVAAESLAGCAHWIAFAMLTAVGAKMIYEALQRDSDAPPADPTRGATLILLAIATSLDALAVGLSMALLNGHVLTPAIAIGIVAAIMSIIGVRFGRTIGSHRAHIAECAGGIVLVLIGVKILLFS